MLIKLVFDATYSIMLFFINMLPVITFPLGILNFINFTLQFINNVSYFVPVGTLMVCATWMIFVENINIMVYIVNWVLKKIPFI